MDVKFEKAPERVLPKCPFCKAKLDRIWIRSKGLGFFQQQQVAICPKCESLLGYGSVRFFG